MIHLDDSVDAQLEARLRSWGSWARDTAPQLNLATVRPVPASAARHRIWPTVLVAALVVVVAGLTAAAPRLLRSSSHRPEAGSAAVARYPVIFDGSLNTTLDFVGTGVELSPPSAGAQASARISWQQALSTCDTSGALCYTNLTAHIYLANAAKVDSQPMPRPAWIIDYRSASCVPFGQPPRLPGSSSGMDPARVYDCRIVNAVDSQTGALLWSLREPTS